MPPAWFQTFRDVTVYVRSTPEVDWCDVPGGFVKSLSTSARAYIVSDHFRRQDAWTAWSDPEMTVDRYREAFTGDTRGSLALHGSARREFLEVLSANPARLHGEDAPGAGVAWTQLRDSLDDLFEHDSIRMHGSGWRAVSVPLVDGSAERIIEVSSGGGPPQAVEKEVGDAAAEPQASAARVRQAQVGG